MLRVFVYPSRMNRARADSSDIITVGRFDKLGAYNCVCDSNNNHRPMSAYDTVWPGDSIIQWWSFSDVGYCLLTIGAITHSVRDTGIVWIGNTLIVHGYTNKDNNNMRYTIIIRDTLTQGKTFVYNAGTVRHAGMKVDTCEDFHKLWWKNEQGSSPRSGRGGYDEIWACVQGRLVGRFTSVGHYKNEEGNDI
jgi:hypothetical protein